MYRLPGFDFNLDARQAEHGVFQRQIAASPSAGVGVHACRVSIQHGACFVAECDKIGLGKTRTDEYLLVMREAHRIGMRTSITMMFGHLETIPERIEHLGRVRDLQDETGGFTAFICWTFQPADTPLGRVRQFPADYAGPPDGKHLKLAGADEYLRTLALSRIFLDNIPNLQASWVTQGPKIGQLALYSGANDMGSVMMEENVVSAAGTTYRLTPEQIRRLISEAGWQPRQRDCYYELIDRPPDALPGAAPGV